MIHHDRPTQAHQLYLPFCAQPSAVCRMLLENMESTKSFMLSKTRDQGENWQNKRVHSGASKDQDGNIARGCAKTWGQREGNESYRFESGKGKPTRLLNEAAERTHWFLFCWHAAGQFYGVILAWHQVGFFQVKRSGTKSEASHLCWDSSGGRWEALKLCCMSSGTKSNVSSCGAKVAVPNRMLWRCVAKVAVRNWMLCSCRAKVAKLDALQLWC